MIRFLIALACASGILHAQSAKYRTLNLENGATVIYTTYSEVSLKDDLRMFGTATASGNTIERMMTDGTNKAWLGFQLRIDRIPGDRPIRFNLSMEPLGGWGFFGQKAAPRVIENGDRVLLDVLQEPGTGRKLFDSFQVGIGVGMGLMPLTRSIPQMPPAGSVIHLRSPHITLHGTTESVLVGNGASNSGSAAGEMVSTGSGKDRFSFSSHAEPGYRMEAVGEGNRLMFVVGNDTYTLDSSAPVMDGPGAWYLWVRVGDPK